jgi:hypothetical protein
VPDDGQAIRIERDVPGVGLIEFVESERHRAYYFTKPDGTRQRLPSVTTIIGATWPKPALMRWYAKHGDEATDKLKAASTRGKAVHTFIENYLDRGAMVFPDDPELHGYLQGAARFLLEYAPEPEAIELLVVHPELRYAGRLDLRAMVRGERAIVDFKTSPSGAVYPEAHVQALAYGLADVECGAPPARRLYIVGLSETGEAFVHESRATEALWRNMRESYDLMAALTSMAKADPVAA